METFQPEIKVDKKNYLKFSYGEPLVIHCNHYNIFLQRTIEDPEYINTTPVLINSAVSVTYSHLKELILINPTLNSPETRLNAAASIFKTFGYGLLDFSFNNVSSAGGDVYSPIQHYGFAWKIKWGLRKTPVDFFTTGFIAASFAVAYDKPQEYYFVEELECIAKGDQQCRFYVTVAEDPILIKTSPKSGNLLSEIPQRENPTNNINENVVNNAILKMSLLGNEEGLIPAFGAYLTHMFANYYNMVSYEFENMMVLKKGERMRNVSRAMLVEAGHVCAFNTFGGIMESAEWHALITPMIKNREDWVHGIVAIVNSFGWGKVTIKELIPNERLTIIVDGSYESNGYLAMYGISDKPKCYLQTGGTAGIMNLLYFGDITTKPTLNETFYNELFGNENNFKAIETKCRCMGDPHCEFVATRNNAPTR